MTQNKFSSCLIRNQLFDDLNSDSAPFLSVKHQLLPEHLVKQYPGLEIVDCLKFSDKWDQGPIDTFIGLQVKNCCQILCELEYQPEQDRFFMLVNNFCIDFESNQEFSLRPLINQNLKGLKNCSTLQQSVPSTVRAEINQINELINSSVHAADPSTAIDPSTLLLDLIFQRIGYSFLD